MSSSPEDVRAVFPTFAIHSLQPSAPLRATEPSVTMGSVVGTRQGPDFPPSQVVIRHRFNGFVMSAHVGGVFCALCERHRLASGGPIGANNWYGDHDPGAVGVAATWVDTAVTPAELRVRNATNDGWVSRGTLDLVSD